MSAVGSCDPPAYWERPTSIFRKSASLFFWTGAFGTDAQGAFGHRPVVATIGSRKLKETEKETGAFRTNFAEKDFTFFEFGSTT
jgi:hypothetical protein